MTKRLPFMRWFPEDYRRDTAHLSIVEDCVYRRLLERMWQAGGTLPNHDRQLARLAGITYKQWLGVKDALLGFFQCVGGVLHQRRIDRDLKKVKTQKCVARKATDSDSRRATHPKRKPLKDNEADSRIVEFPSRALARQIPDTKTPHIHSESLSPSLRSVESAPPGRRASYEPPPQIEPKQRSSTKPQPDFDLASQDPDEKIGTGKGAKQDEKGFRRALAYLCLDPEVVDNIVTARRLKRAVLTPLAGRNLAAALASCGDATDAAILMIDKGWLGIKPDWYQREQARYKPLPQGNGQAYEDETTRSQAYFARKMAGHGNGGAQ